MSHAAIYNFPYYRRRDSINSHERRGRENRWDEGEKQWLLGTPSYPNPLRANREADGEIGERKFGRMEDFFEDVGIGRKFGIRG